MADNEVMRCTSCGRRVETEDNWVEFKCPSCGKGKVLRCNSCKKLQNVYKCGSCGFEGP